MLPQIGATERVLRVCVTFKFVGMLEQVCVSPSHIRVYRLHPVEFRTNHSHNYITMAGNCNMGAYQKYQGQWHWLTPMLMDKSPCPPECPPGGCK